MAVHSERVVNPGSNHSPLEFSALIHECDVLLCGDTLALHIASALSVPSVALFGPTSSSEIHDYDGLIEKISWNALDCLCCYGDCRTGDDCMSLIPVDEIVNRIEEHREKTSRVVRVSGSSGEPTGTPPP